MVGDAVAGGFVFDGGLGDLAGLFVGGQLASGNAVGYSVTPTGRTMIQYGVQVALAAEVTAGYTNILTPSGEVVTRMVPVGWGSARLPG